MKKIFLMVMVVLAGFTANAQFSGATLQASGLTCAMCTKAINKALEKLPFVGSVKADIKNSAFMIGFKPGVDVDIDGLRKSVEGAGFSVAKLQLTGIFNKLEVKNDVHQVIEGMVFHFLGTGNKMLDGEQRLTVVDKNFIPAKEFKKISAATKMSCIQTGKAAECCTRTGFAAGTRIYHVTI